MEIRLRRLITSARTRKHTSAEYETDGTTPLPKDLMPGLSRATTNLMVSNIDTSGRLLPIEEGVTLQAISYESVCAGKSPIFTSRPVKGNGPIKLQTSWRLSTGEVLAASQDNQSTLEDILEGDYVVGCKERRNIQDKSVQPPDPLRTPALSASYSDSLTSPRTAPETPTSPWSLKSREAFESPSAPLKSSTCDISGTATSHASSKSQSSVHEVGDANTTITALWKAERNRLIDIYSHREDDRNKSNYNKAGRSRIVPLAETDYCGRLLEAALEPPPHIAGGDCADNTNRSSNVSSSSSYSRGDRSYASSSHTTDSMISTSTRPSSCATHTSKADREAMIARADIRKAVNEMRSTYLQALGTRAPTSSPTPAQRTRKTHRMKLVAPAQASTSSVHSKADRQTWHGGEADMVDKSRRRHSKMRATSHPISRSGRLSPVTASPPSREKRPTLHLQRADSTTLGSSVLQIESEGKKSQSIQYHEVSNRTGRSSSAPQACGSSTIRKPLRTSRKEILIPTKQDATGPAMRPVGNFF